MPNRPTRSPWTLLDDNEDVLKVGEHEFTWQERTRAKVELHDAEGNSLAIVNVPYDPDNQPSEDEVLASAWEFYSTIEHINSRITDDEVSGLANDLQTGEYGKWLLSIVEEYLGTVSVTINPDTNTPEAIEEAKEASLELTKTIREKRAVVIEAFFEGGEFWANMARDILTHAWSEVFAEVNAEHPNPEDISDDAFDAEMLKRWRGGPYLAGAILTLSPLWGQHALEIIAAGLSTSREEGGLGIAEQLEEKARTAVRKRRSMIVPAQGMRRLYDDDGYSRLPSDGITIGHRRAILGGATLWQPVPGTLRPEMAHRIGKEGGYAHYMIDSAIFPTPEDAFAVVRRYGLGHLDVFHYILQLWLANRDKDHRGPFDGVYFGFEQFLDDRGVARHKNGYHKPENIEDVVSQLRALEHLMVSGNVPPPHKRSKQPPLKVSAHSVEITQWVTQPRLDGTEKYIACYVRPGDWAAEIQDMAPQFAITMRSVLQLNNKNQHLPKQLALYILEQFKIRSSYGTFTNPFYIETLLEGACLPIDKKNPGRFRSRVEAAFDALKTLDPPIIKSWHYVDQVPKGGHGMLKKWRGARVRFVPTADLTKGYATIQENRDAKIERNQRRTKPPKLAAKNASTPHP